MNISRLFSRLKEGVFALDCQVSIMDYSKMQAIIGKYFPKQPFKNLEHARFQRLMCSMWVNPSSHQDILSLESYFLDWYRSGKFKIERIETGIESLRLLVQNIEPQHGSQIRNLDEIKDPIPIDLVKSHPVEMGALFRAIIRKVYAERPAYDLNEAGIKELILSKIDEFKEDLQKDKLVRAIDSTARLNFFIRNKQMDQKISRAKWMHFFKQILYGAAVMLVFEYFSQRKTHTTPI